MFQGTKHIPEDKHLEYLQKAGASSVDGSTSHDRTNYFEVVPSNQLELALWLESERMGFLWIAPASRRPSTTSATWSRTNADSATRTGPPG